VALLDPERSKTRCDLVVIRDRLPDAGVKEIWRAESSIRA
jgi:hypothetical protein